MFVSNKFVDGFEDKEFRETNIRSSERKDISQTMWQHSLNSYNITHWSIPIYVYIPPPNVTQCEW
jgi:hypothetical protein